MPLLAASSSGQLGGAASLGFDGLVHARLGFDRHALRSMQNALGAAGAQQLQPEAVWLPPGDAAPAPPPAWPSQQQAQGTEPALPAEGVERLRRLQPTADAVARFSAGMRERGGQRLNAEQRNAVAAVVCGGGRAYPYGLFGPPGERGGRWER